MIMAPLRRNLSQGEVTHLQCSPSHLDQLKLRALAKEFPDPSQDPLGFSKEFRLTIQAYKPGLSGLYQLIQLLVSESKAREWKAGWKHPLMDFESHSPPAHTN